MKKLILLLLLLLTSSFSFADITSEDERFTLLCQADKMTGFQWRDGEWQFTRYKPVMTIIKKHDDEKSAEDDGWVREDAVNEMCAYRQSKSGKNTCYSIKQIGRNPGKIITYLLCKRYFDFLCREKNYKVRSLLTNMNFAYQKIPPYRLLFNEK